MRHAGAHSRSCERVEAREQPGKLQKVSPQPGAGCDAGLRNLESSLRHYSRLSQGLSWKWLAASGKNAGARRRWSRNRKWIATGGENAEAWGWWGRHRKRVAAGGENAGARRWWSRNRKWIATGGENTEAGRWWSWHRKRVAAQKSGGN